MKLKNYLCATVLASGIAVTQSASAGGIPVIDAASISNDVTSWVQDTMTELNHHIQNYETMINQYETMYNQYNYLKSQYSGLITNMKSISDLQSMYETYRQGVEAFNATITRYNNLATTANKGLASLCDKLESKALNTSACSDEIRDFLKDMETTNQMIQDTNNPDKKGSFANEIQKESKSLKDFLDEWGTRPAGVDDKAGQIMKDMRQLQADINVQLIEQRKITKSQLDELQLQRLEKETRKATNTKRQLEFHEALERDAQMFYEEGQKVKAFFNK